MCKIEDKRYQYVDEHLTKIRNLLGSRQFNHQTRIFGKYTVSWAVNPFACMGGNFVSHTCSELVGHLNEHHIPNVTVRTKEDPQYALKQLTAYIEGNYIDGKQISLETMLAVWGYDIEIKETEVLGGGVNWWITYGLPPDAPNGVEDEVYSIMRAYPQNAWELVTALLEKYSPFKPILACHEKIYDLRPAVSEIRNHKKISKE